MIDLSELWRPPLYWWTYSIHFNPVYYSISMLGQWPGTVASEATCAGIFRIFQVVMLLKAKELSYQSMHLSDFDCDFDIKPLDSSTPSFHRKKNAIQVKDTPSCKWHPSQRRRQYKPDRGLYCKLFINLGCGDVILAVTPTWKLQYWSSNLMNITCIHGQTAGVQVVPVAPALVSQNIEGSNGANGAGEPEDSTMFLIQLCFVDRLEVWHHNFEPMAVEFNTSSLRS